MLSLAETVVWIDRNTQEQHHRVTLKKRQAQERLTTATKPEGFTRIVQPVVPAKLRQVIKTGKNRLLIHTVLGPIMIEGQNLTCSPVRN